MPPTKRAPIKVENNGVPPESTDNASELAELREEIRRLQARADDSDARAAAASAPSDDPKEAVTINLNNWLTAKKAARPDVDFSELEEALESEDWDNIRDVSGEFLANNGGKELESLRPLLADYRRAYRS